LAGSADLNTYRADLNTHRADFNIYHAATAAAPAAYNNINLKQKENIFLIIFKFNVINNIRQVTSRAKKYKVATVLLIAN